MKELLRKYSFELISAAVIIVLFIIILPKSNVDIPNIEDIQLTGLDMTFVSDDTGSLVPASGEIITTPLQDTGTSSLTLNNSGSVSVDNII